MRRLRRRLFGGGLASVAVLSLLLVIHPGSRSLTPGMQLALGTDFTMTGSATNLAPGAPNTLPILVTNNLPQPITVNSITVEATTVPAGCPIANLTVNGAAFSATSPPQVIVTGLSTPVGGAGSGTNTATISLPIELVSGAPNNPGCNNVNGNVSYGFTYVGTATYTASCVNNIPTSGSNVTPVTGTRSGDYEVTNGQVLYLNGGTITGNVTVDATGELITQGGTIKGNLTSHGGPMSIQGTAVNGSLQSQGGALSMGPGTVASKGVSISGGGTVFCSLGASGQPVTITGSLQIQQLGTSSNTETICDTNVSQNLTYQNNGSPLSLAGSTGCGNTIGGGLTVQNNTALLTVGTLGTGNGNTVTGNIAVNNNTLPSPPPGTSTLTNNSTSGNCTLGSDNPKIVGSGNSAPTGKTNTCNAPA